MIAGRDQGEGEGTVQTIELEVRNPSGLHARPAATFVRAAAASGSQITVENLSRGGSPANARSILAVLALGVERGHRIRLTAVEGDEAAAIDSLAQLIRDGLGEPVEPAESVEPAEPAEPAGSTASASEALGE